MVNNYGRGFSPTLNRGADHSKHGEWTFSVGREPSLKGIDLFAGAGGMALGAEAAGISIELAVENNRYAVETYVRNHAGVGVFSEDIRKITKKDLPFTSRGTIVFGGPPCKGFSTSNQRTRNRDNPTNHLYLEYLRVVRLVRPEWVVFENVTGIQETEGGYFLTSIKNMLLSYGYTVSSSVLDASNYGVPQRRSRLFLIGSLNGVGVKIPPPLSLKPVTVAEALRDLPRLVNGAAERYLPYRRGIEPSKYASVLRGNLTHSTNHFVTRNSDAIVNRYKHVPQGGNWENIPSHLMRNYADQRRCHSGVYHRLDPHRPSKVIGNFRKNMLIHPFEDRGLSVREAARLQSFPDSFEFKGTIGFQQEQIGNAVPPLLSRVVFEAILASCS